MRPDWNQKMNSVSFIITSNHDCKDRTLSTWQNINPSYLREDGKCISSCQASTSNLNKLYNFTNPINGSKQSSSNVKKTFAISCILC